MPRHRVATYRAYNNILIEATDYINEHYKREITLDDFAASVTYSRRAIQRALTHYNQSWRKMLTKRRMEEASRLLLNTVMIVRDVAHEVGYKQPAQFAKAFRAEYNIAPAEFRRRYQTARRPGV